MKLVYITGLGHSGTTLLNQLLTQHTSIVSLGEVASIFSPQHMRAYEKRWKDAPDFDLCSCGLRWSTCPFWGKIEHLSGLKSQDPLGSKYRALFEYVRSTRGDDVVIVDSSKSLPALDAVLETAGALGLPRKDILLIHAVRDVRGFVCSRTVGQKASRSFVGLLRMFNLWLGSNREIKEYLEDRALASRLVLYENLCADPVATVDRLLDGIDVPRSCGSVELGGDSHIVMGNKNFTMRNRSRVRYDMRWFTDDLLNLVYQLHWPARRFNRQIYSESAG